MKSGIEATASGVGFVGFSRAKTKPWDSLGVLRRDYGDDSTYGAPGPNVNGVHCPCTLGRFVKCLFFIGVEPGLPFSLRSHSHCFSASYADAFFNPTVFVCPFAYVAVTCGSPPRRISATTSAVAAPTRARNASNRPDAIKSTAPLLVPVRSQYTRRSARSCVTPRMDMRAFVFSCARAVEGSFRRRVTRQRVTHR